MKNKLYQQIDRLMDHNIRTFVMVVLNNAPEPFWTAPSSSSGNYHPPEDQGEGGLVRHLIKSAEISQELANFYKLSEKDRDIVIASSIIHDIQKNGIPWGSRTDYKHGLIASEWLGQFSLDELDKINICNCVRFHMGRWCEPKEELIMSLSPNTNELIVQLSDYISSRKGASFLPGINLTKEAIEGYK